MKYHYSILWALFLSCWQAIGFAARADSNLAGTTNIQPLQSSVLAEGAWYKLAVVESGMYKIDADWLRKAGIDLNGIDPQKISIYGYGGGMLPQANSAERPIDLPELAIYVNGEDDGRFDAGDFIVFYAEGPDKISYNDLEKSFSVQKNLYADSAFYFLTVQNNKGKRVSYSENLGTEFPVISHFDDYIHHEKERYNILSSGREWYGERFSPGTTETFGFETPHFLANSQVKIFSRVMSSYTTPGTLELSSNNNLIGKITTEAIPRVDFNTGQNLYAVKGHESQEWFEFDVASLDNNKLNISMTFSATSGTGYAYLNSLLIQFKRTLLYQGHPYLFQSIESLSQSNTTFQIENTQEKPVYIWDITDPHNAHAQAFEQSGKLLRYGASTSTLRRYAVFDIDNLTQPSYMGKVPNQNIRAAVDVDMLIVSPPDFMAAAIKLADFRESHDNLKVKVASPSQIYNEFSSGRQDVTAIRDYAKHLYDHGNLKYLLLMGKSSYAYKDHLVIVNSNFVPTYQSYNSLHPVETYSSDDFFGFMEAHEGDWAEGTNADEHDLEIGIGRLPVKTLAEAQTVVDKLIHYSHNVATYGPWRNEVVFVADDGDANIHQRDSDRLAEKIDSTFSDYHINKIYLGAYPQQGNSSPATQQAISNAIKRGALIVNYSGHGNESIWAEEKILTFDMINQWENYDKLPLFVIATCEFGKYDDPYQVSGGEQLLLSPKGGAIGLVATSRPVYSNTNFLLNNALYDVIFDKTPSGSLRLGEIVKTTKNNSVSGWRNRNFTLLGDPSMQLAIPQKSIKISDIYVEEPKPTFDTLKALSKVHIQGYVSNYDGSKATDFNGVAHATVYDKPSTSATLSVNGPVMSYNEQNNMLFKGKVTVKDGSFHIEFIVPKNIDYALGNGKLLLYALDQEHLEDAHLGYIDIVIGGSAPEPLEDNTPPVISLYMDDISFESGGLTGSNTLLVAHIKDESGINIAHGGLGQDIVATLNNSAEFVLNDFFESEIDTYKEGWINYPFSDLPEGHYTLRLKAWDTFSNSSEKHLNFIVVSNAKLALQNVFNYPNPFKDETRFSIDHNRAKDNLEIVVNIYSMEGKLINTIQTITDNSDSIIDSVIWDGTDKSGNKISSGIYIYKVIVKSLTDSSYDTQYNRLVIIN